MLKDINNSKDDIKYKPSEIYLTICDRLGRAYASHFYGISRKSINGHIRISCQGVFHSRISAYLQAD